jgi:hypothetical protein
MTMTRAKKQFILNFAFPGLLILAFLAVFVGIIPTFAGASAPSPAIEAPSERVAGEVAVLSESSTRGSDTKATVTELQFARPDGAEVICFRLHVTELHGSAGGIDCPEWAQPTLEPKTKEHPKP